MGARALPRTGLIGTTDPRTRQLGDERARYARKGLRERIDDVVGWIGEHRIASLVIAVFLLVGALLWASKGQQVDPTALRVGDCLFVPLPANQGSDQPIGQPVDVAAAILAGGAERAGCTASHGHEVSARAQVPAVPPLPSGVSALPTVRAEAKDACDAAFAAYVGQALDASRYETFPVVPTSFDTTADVVCLVARADGQWMDHPARASGE